MKPARRSARFAPLAALVLAGPGCAHVAAPAAATPPGEEAPARALVLVTGSRLPQAVQAGRPLPDTISPVRIYTRQQLQGTGQVGLGAALDSLDPSAR